MLLLREYLYTTNVPKNFCVQPKYIKKTSKLYVNAKVLKQVLAYEPYHQNIYRKSTKILVVSIFKVNTKCQNGILFKSIHLNSIRYEYSSSVVLRQTQKSMTQTKQFPPLKFFSK